MAELALDVAVANRFISSLSKSLQALCHGCMDFNSGIEIVGYINVNIDCGSQIDYVLNEKVQKSDNNSMKFISNSFLAKKDQQKQTRDGSCSPVLELQTQSFHSTGYQRHSFQHPSAQHHRASYPYSSQVMRGAQKRAWGGTERDWRSPKKYSRGARSSISQHQANRSSAFSSSAAVPTSSDTFLQPEIPGSSNGMNNSDVEVKKELFISEDASGYSETNSVQNSENKNINSDSSNGNSSDNNINIKKDPDAISGNEGAITDTNDQSDNFLQTSNEQNSGETTDNQYTLNDPSNNAQSSSEQSQDNFANEHNEDPELPIEFDQQEGDAEIYPQGSEQGETSGDGAGFDVIEIEDEDEDMKAMFGDNRK